MKRRDETENIRAVVDMKMRGSALEEVEMEDTVRRDLKAWNIGEEWATDRDR